ncbi:hypothetical protein B1143_00535 [Enterococcus faecium]|nr:hypothetical protein B1143_00535 [Enterococcus faecium]
MLKSLAILPSGSAGKFLKKIWNLGQLGGEEANFASVLRPPIVCRVPIFVPKSALSLLYQWIEPFFFDHHFAPVFNAVLKKKKK